MSGSLCLICSILTLCLSFLICIYIYAIYRHQNKTKNTFSQTLKENEQIESLEEKKTQVIPSPISMKPISSPKTSSYTNSISDRDMEQLQMIRALYNQCRKGRTYVPLHELVSSSEYSYDELFVIVNDLYRRNSGIIRLESVRGIKGISISIRN